MQVVSQPVATPTTAPTVRGLPREIPQTTFNTPTLNKRWGWHPATYIHIHISHARGLYDPASPTKCRLVFPAFRYGLEATYPELLLEDPICSQLEGFREWCQQSIRLDR